MFAASAGLASVMIAGAALAGVATAQQVKAPRYQSPINAPAPQLVALPAPAAITPNATVVEDVIVRVNDQIIDRSDVERAEKQLGEDGVQQKLSSADMADRQKNLLRDMIDQQLLISRGKELGINADAEVIRRLDEIRKQNKFETMEELERAARQSGVSYEDFKAQIKNSIITQQVVRDEVQRHMQMTPREEQTYYEAHKAEYTQPEQVALSEILIPTPADATDAQVAQAKAKADDVAAQIAAGGKFDELAKKYSGGPTAAQGGDLGQPFKRGAMASVFDDQTFKLPTGGVTTPIRTRQGFVLLKVTKHIPAGVPPLKDVDEQVQEAMYQAAITPALRAYLTKLREEAYIDIAPGFVDSGASPKETKPVFATFTPAPVKKKKVEQKQRLDTKKATVAPVTAQAGAPVVTTPASGSTDSAVMGPATSSSGTSSTPAVKTVAMTSTKKPKKIKREKVRYGQAPRNSLPEGAEQTVAAGADQGAGATSGVLPAPGAAMTQSGLGEVAANTSVDPLGPQAPERKKTRFADRPDVPKDKTLKSAKAIEKAGATPVAMSGDEKAQTQIQDSALGLGGDTATKKKKPKVKGAAKERLQDEAPKPAAVKPDETPIPSKAVRDNGEPAVTPRPAADATTLAPTTAPAPGAPAGGAQTSPTPVTTAPGTVPPQ